MKVISKANPNHHGWIKLIDYGDCWCVTTPADAEGIDYLSEAEARTAYNAEVAYYAKLPNHKLQAEYDEIWGEPLQFPPH